MNSPKLKGLLLKRLDKGEMNEIDMLHMQLSYSWSGPSGAVEYWGGKNPARSLENAASSLVGPCRRTLVGVRGHSLNFP